ncbi:MFS transporter [Pseudonocardia hispaniensis]|uniref:MFS transporter n=1 Tax=Pseudonocardia hispaniensis TaxID=904933 RepID=A0ABW1IXA6_9PSEU
MSIPTRTAVRTELFGPARRATTIGLLLLISLIAFEAMGVGTAMPAIVADLGAVSQYAWPFVAFMASAVIGTVFGGRWCDVAGPRIPLVVAPALFGSGLVVAGTAGGMGQLLVGRFLQGLGAGVLGVAVYVLVAAVYPQHVRPAVFGLVSSAWVLPALIGPPVSGIVTERLSWHWVFLGLVPVVLLAVALVLPACRRLGPPDPAHATPPARRGFALASVGAAVGVSTLSWASQQTGALAGVVAAAAVVLLVPSMHRLLPVGVFRARPGVPTLVAARGLLAGTFFTVNSYLPLMLAGTHRWSLTTAGIPLLVGSLGWSASSAWQGRHPDLARHRLLRAGFGLLATGTAGMLLVAPAWGTPWLAVPLWAVAGVGMGLGFSSVAYLLLAQSGPGEVGFHSAAAQLSDQLTTATMIAAGGGLLAMFGSAASALPILVAVLTAMAVLGVLIAGRTAGERP